MYEKCEECGNEFGIVHPRAIRPENRTVPLCPKCYNLTESIYLEGKVDGMKEHYDRIRGGNYADNRVCMP